MNVNAIGPVCIKINGAETKVPACNNAFVLECSYINNALKTEAVWVETEHPEEIKTAPDESEAWEENRAQKVRPVAFKQ